MLQLETWMDSKQDQLGDQEKLDTSVVKQVLNVPAFGVMHCKVPKD